MISQVLAMLVGAKLLRDRLGIAGRGFPIYVASCVTALVILMTTFGAVAVALLYAFQLPFESSSFR